MLETNEERKIRIKQLLISIVPIGLILLITVYLLFGINRSSSLKY